MTRTAKLSLVAITVLLVLSVIVGILVGRGHHASTAASHPPASSSAAPTRSITPPTSAPPPPVTSPYVPPATSPPPATSSAAGGAGDPTGEVQVLSAADVAAGHKVILGYLHALGSYVWTDREPEWQRVALAYTDHNPAITSATVLPSGQAWAQCQVSHCRSVSAAHLVKDISLTDVSGGGKQVVSDAALSTTITGTGSQTNRQQNVFTVSAVQKQGHWVVIGAYLAGMGDGGEQGG